MKQKPNETYEEYALRRAKRSERFSTFALITSAVCWALVFVIKIICN